MFKYLLRSENAIYIMNMPNISKLIILLSLVILNTVLFDEAFAYIDPGSGSLIIQTLIGALVGITIAVRVYWERIKMKFSSSSKSND